MQMSEPNKGAAPPLRTRGRGLTGQKKAREPKPPGWEVLGEDA